jgi:hypothetical protein
VQSKVVRPLEIGSAAEAGEAGEKPGNGPKLSHDPGERHTAVCSAEPKEGPNREAFTRMAVRVERISRVQFGL